jgi:hypothetical protein
MSLRRVLRTALACVPTIAVVDRIEGSLAVLENADEALVDVPLALFPNGLREGDRVLLAACPSPSRVSPDARAPHGAVAHAPVGTERPGAAAPTGDHP